MNTHKCPCCGKENSFVKKEKNFTVMYGQKTLTEKMNVVHCKFCDAEFDLNEKENDNLRKEAMLAVRQQSVCESLKKIEEKISFAELERCFNLSPKTFSKWKTKEKSPSASAAAFVSLLNVFPWLSLIGMSNFDPVESYKIACAAVLKKAKQDSSNFVLPVSINAYDAIVLGYDKTQNYKMATNTEIKSVGYQSTETVSYGVK